MVDREFAKHNKEVVDREFAKHGEEVVDKEKLQLRRVVMKWQIIFLFLIFSFFFVI